MKKIKFMFHVHTWYSNDSNNTFENIINYCRKMKIDVVAITDHNEIKGAQKLKKIAQDNPRVIIGEEIYSREGEVIGLFLNKKIQKGMSIIKTIEEIIKQGGVVCLPHPGETFRRSAVKKDKVIEIIDKIDVIEVFNSRTLLNKDNRWAFNIAKKYNKPFVVGSDSHIYHELGRTINIIDTFNLANEFIGALKNNLPQIQKRTGLLIQLYSKILKIKRKISKKYI